MPEGTLTCPVCSALVFREELEQASARAAELTATGNYAAARDTWRTALQYLPIGSRQYQLIGEKIHDLNQKAPESKKEKAVVQEGGFKNKFGFFIVIGLFFWKFKIIIAFVLTKGKLLLLGLTKASTFFSIFLSLGVYWSLFGWPLAAGLLFCIYLHEMGHVFELTRLGIKASAPMFIPGFGAFVRLHENPANPVENARVGLGGPVWGLIATGLCFGAFELSGTPVLGALARLSAWINLFNLLPFWQLDGNRGLAALTKMQRLALAGATLFAFVLTHEGLLVLIAILIVFRAFGKDAPVSGDKTTLYKFAVLLVALALLSAIEVKTSGVLVLPGKERPDTGTGIGASSL